MKQTAEPKKDNNTVELATFYIGESLCGMDILRVQEINKPQEITHVPQSPDFVLGVLNLRGRIVTVIDLGIKLGLSPIELSKENRNIIVDSGDEYIGLLVNRISDVVKADTRKIDPPPANIGGLQGKFFEGIFKTEESLIGILNVEEALQKEVNAS